MKYPFFTLVCFWSWGQVDFRTNIVYVDSGEFSETGTITTSVSENIFPNISADNPIFLVFTFPYNITLSQTLVDFEGDGHTNRPINLSLRYEGVDTANAQVVAPQDAVSIVRWIRGENSVWIRIQSPTHLWLEKGGLPSALNDYDVCVFSIGVTARNTFLRNNVPFDLGLANLRANSRVAAPHDIENTAVSTLLLFDTRPFSGDRTDFNLTTFFTRFVALDPELVMAENPPTLVGADIGMPIFSGDDTTYRFDIRTPRSVSIYGQSTSCNPGIPGFSSLQFDVNIGQAGVHSSLIEIHLPEDSDYGFDFGDLVPLHPTYDPYTWAGDIPQEVIPQGFHLPVTSGATLYEAYVPQNARFFESSNGKVLARDAIVQIERGPVIYFRVELLCPASLSNVTAHAEFVRFDIDALQWLDTAPFELTQKYAPQRRITFPARTFQVGYFPVCKGN